MQILNVVPSISCKCFLLEQGETSNISIFVYIKIVWFHLLWFSTFPGNFPKFDAEGRRSWSKCRKCLSIPCGSAQWASRIGTLTTGVSKITTSLNRLLGISSKNRRKHLFKYNFMNEMIYSCNSSKKWGLCCRYTFLSRHRWCTLTTYWVLHNFTTTTAGDLPPLESTPTSPGIVATFDSGLHVGWIAMCILWRSGFGSWADFCLLVDLPRLPWLTTGWLIPTQKNMSSEIIGCRSFIKIVIYTSWHMAWEK